MPQTPSPTYERLRDTIARRMRMSHVYQPLMLMELLGRRSPAPAQDVARRILGEDVTQIEYYTERVNRMVGKVHLQRHHPLRPGRLRPGGRRGTKRRRARRATAAVPPAPRCLPNAARRGGGLFAHAEACGFGHRSRHRTPISGSIKVRVLTRAKGRCECCGAHEHQRALEVDHIVPRNQGGSDDLSNLQALCFRCNAGKRDAVCLRKRAPPTSAVCRPAMATAKRAVCSARWRAAAGCCWRTKWRSPSHMPIP